jgi:MHS family proline/betaine transporter-like MFS transporter
MIAAGCMLGVVLSILASMICSWPQMPLWIWRVPFLIGFLISLVGLYVRLKLEETPRFSAQKPHNTKALSFFIALRHHFKPLLLVVLLAGCNGIALYVYTVFLPEFIIKERLLGVSVTKLYTCIGAVLLCVGLVVFGFLSDKLKRSDLIRSGCILTILSAGLLFYHLSTLSFLGIVGYQLFFVVTFSLYSGPLNTYIVEIFTVGTRYRCASIGYSIGMGFIGGSAPFIASLLALNQYKNFLLAGYLIVSGLFAFVALQMLKKLEIFNNQLGTVVIHSD